MERHLQHLRIPVNRFSTKKRQIRRGFGDGFGYSEDERIVQAERLQAGIQAVFDSETQAELKLSSDVLKITMRQQLRLNQHKRVVEALHLKWLNPVGSNTVIAALPKSARGEFGKRLAKYKETGRGKTNFDEISKIETIQITDRITASQVMGDEPAPYDVEFFSDLSLEDYERSIDYVRALCEDKQNLYPKLEDMQIPYVRVKLTAQAATKIAANVPAVKKIEYTPPLSAQVVRVPKGAPEVNFEPASDNLERIMIIDCGINPNHPGIRNVLLTQKNFITGADVATDIENGDSEGHGTAVAGLAAYGFISNTTNLKPTSKIGVAKILDGPKDTKPIETLLEDIVINGVSKSFRVYSLTVMLPKIAISISKLAYIIDKLCRRYNILFVISTGNIFPNSIEEFQRFGQDYPLYFSNPMAKIFEGAESACALTIGGIAHLETPTSMSKKWQASPFTRAGPTHDGRLKPELMHFAGNYETPATPSEKLGVLTFNHRLTEGIFVSDSGTSFSTPIVANLASQILQNYPGVSANLLRALIIHNSSIPEQARHAGDPLYVYGFGFPDADRAIASTKFSPTMICEGEITSEQVAEIRIPVPKELGSAKGSKLMRITLAYDPPVSRQNAEIDYCMLNLQFKVLRRHNSGEYKPVGGKDASWQTPYYRLTESNTIKKDTFQWEKGHTDEDWIIEITPIPRDGKIDIGKQRFALVVSIEEMRKEIDLYSIISAQFEAEKMKLKAMASTPQPQRIHSKRN